MIEGVVVDKVELAFELAAPGLREEFVDPVASVEVHDPERSVRFEVERVECGSRHLGVDFDDLPDAAREVAQKPAGEDIAPASEE